MAAGSTVGVAFLITAILTELPLHVTSFAAVGAAWAAAPYCLTRAIRRP